MVECIAKCRSELVSLSYVHAQIGVCKIRQRGEMENTKGI